MQLPLVKLTWAARGVKRIILLDIATGSRSQAPVVVRNLLVRVNTTTPYYSMRSLGGYFLDF